MSQEQLDTDKSVTNEPINQEEVSELVSQSEQTPKSTWLAKLGNRRVLTLAAIGLLGLGVLAGAGGYKLAHQADRWEDAIDNRFERHQVQQGPVITSTQAVETKVDMSQAVEAVLKEAGSGYVSEIDLDTQNQSPYYEVTLRDGQKESQYQVDATSGKVVASETDYEDDRDAEDTTKPKADMTALLKAVSAKYDDAQILSVSIEDTSSGQLVYQVEVLQNGTQITSQFGTNDAKFISDITHSTDNDDDWDD